MMIVMRETATDEEVEAVVHKIEGAGARAHRSRGERVTVIGAIGDVEQDVSIESLGLEGLPGVDRVVPILKPYKLASVQITHGARNMQNYPLLAEIGRCGRPALLKRGLSAPLDELLMAAEYILKEGNPNVMLCERGIRTFETDHRRVTLDLMAVPILKELSHLPVIVDPSHAAGRRELVQPMSLAAAAAGADGIIVETHPNPEEAVCDGPQALRADGFAEYVADVEQAAMLAGKALSAV